MKTTAYHEWLPGICIRPALLVLFSLVPLTACGNESQRDLLETLKQGVSQQLREVEFKCTYTYSEYVVDTLEEAENFDTSKGRLVVHATGALAKTKKMTYESFVLDTLDTKNPGAYMDHITVTNPELRAEYYKQSLNHSHRTLFIDERQEKNKDLPILDIVNARIICPLNIAGSRENPCFLDQILFLYDKAPDCSDFRIENGENCIYIYANYNKPEAEVTERVFTVSNSYPYPVLMDKKTRTTLYYPKLNSKKEKRSSLKALDFVSLNDGCVLPRKIHLFSTITFDDFRKEDIGKWVVSKWESDDMGKEKPKKSDFYIYLDRNSDIGGLDLNLNYKLEKNLPEYFDINKYSIRDLQRSSPIESQVDGKPDLTVWIRPAIILVAGFLIVFGLWKKWKRAKQSAPA
ncbi:MAG: hypothetical protein IKT12_00785 [Thermoguttaceae bacterium]|nr:hypothetical protein [Thermoguttaceae bacterium]